MKSNRKAKKQLPADNDNNNLGLGDWKAVDFDERTMLMSGMQSGLVSLDVCKGKVVELPDGSFKILPSSSASSAAANDINENENKKEKEIVVKNGIENGGKKMKQKKEKERRKKSAEEEGEEEEEVLGKDKEKEKEKQKKDNVVISSVGGKRTELEISSDNSNSILKIKNMPKKPKLQQKPQKQNIAKQVVEEEEEEINEKKEEEEEEISFEAWDKFGLDERLLKGIKELKFSTPTDIQAASLQAAILHHLDIIGAAPTGCGKTLAFGLPILNYLLKSDAKGNRNDISVNADKEDDDDDDDGDDDVVVDDNDDKEDADAKDEAKNKNKNKKKKKKKKKDSNPLKALILVPTRELALQVSDHLKAVAKFTPIRIATFVGGLSIEKQERIIDQHPPVIVATPGRLWELMSLGHSHVCDFHGLTHFVIDEADRMVESGHFKELNSILALINGDKTNNYDGFQRFTFVFSATLTLPKAVKLSGLRKMDMNRKDSYSTVQKLMDRIDFRRKTKLIDLSNKSMTVEKLKEVAILCGEDAKDYYLYYLAMTCVGRIIVFVNSISCGRRLKSVFDLLRLPVFGLHAEMQQRQRIKNLERFSSSKHALLIATDVAARGLDIKGVEYVVHYQLPRTSEIYIHRSGRTARANTSGLSIALVSPTDQMTYKRICYALKKPEGLGKFNVEEIFFKAVKMRVDAATKLEAAVHADKKQKTDRKWFRDNAKALEIEVDDNFASAGDDDDEDEDDENVYDHGDDDDDDDDEEDEEDDDDEAKEEDEDDDRKKKRNNNNNYIKKNKNNYVKKKKYDEDEEGEISEMARRKKIEIIVLKKNLNDVLNRPFLPSIGRKDILANAHDEASIRQQLKMLEPNNIPGNKITADYIKNKKLSPSANLKK